MDFGLRWRAEVRQKLLRHWSSPQVWSQFRYRCVRCLTQLAVLSGPACPVFKIAPSISPAMQAWLLRTYTDVLLIASPAVLRTYCNELKNQIINATTPSVELIFTNSGVLCLHGFRMSNVPAAYAFEARLLSAFLCASLCVGSSEFVVMPASHTC